MPEGQTVRIPLPELNEERREELVKVAGRYASRRALRCAMSAAMAWIKLKSRKRWDISQDDAKAQSADVQDSTDKFIKLVDETLETKEGEIRQV